MNKNCEVIRSMHYIQHISQYFIRSCILKQCALNLRQCRPFGWSKKSRVMYFITILTIYKYKLNSSQRYIHNGIQGCTSPKHVWVTLYYLSSPTSKIFAYAFVCHLYICTCAIKHMVSFVQHPWSLEYFRVCSKAQQCLQSQDLNCQCYQTNALLVAELFCLAGEKTAGSSLLL